ncbi:HpcH/HpaI aldolase/citrate lyase family protein [Nitratireductor mangrovi]|uniref:HpcH/HpaI aldolase/citrate lyase family protein n=1 Tax=Nitratireductor mangrovi TaxID=2599600 RepID=A0A5B8KV89_9HYPH|nr:HpcH/HpaI aldolase/citrate lyase family protein [Nitratireductor mangrovi]QDY99553.1 HpcH/HpaI aldolase/citrate lyase family protein [Nitratireductor mangrovi]
MTLASRLAAGETLFTAWSSVPDTITVEILARQGFDAVTLDMQHGGHHEDSVVRGIAPIAAVSRHAVVRVPVGRFDMASRALDFGAEAVIAPMVNSVADARRFAAAMKYPPVGERSWGPTFAMPRAGIADAAEWLGSQNAATISFAMIETREAYALLDEILGVPGIDGIFVGPSDFSIAWTGGAQMNPGLDDMMQAIADIADRTRAAGKHAAIYVIDPALCGSFHAMGYRLFALGNEQRYITLGAQQLLGVARGEIG